MTDNDDLLNELKAALEEEPSREFAAGVRARVTQSQVRIRQAWWGLAAAAAVALATVALWRPAVDAPPSVVATPNLVAVPVAPHVAPEPARTTKPVTPAVTRRTTFVSQTVEAISAEPKLEVITNQPEVLRQLWARYRGRPLVAGDGEPVVDGLSAKPITVNPIEVQPIVVGELGAESGRGGAAPIIRRVAATKETR